MKKNYLFVSDVDDTLLGNNQSLAKLTATLNAARDQIVIAYNSSRPCASIRKSLEEQVHLPQPDYLIGALGTEIQDTCHGEAIGAYTNQWVADWKRNEVAALMNRLGFAAHEDEFQTPFKASYHVLGDAQYQRVLEHLKREGIRAKVIFSSGKDIDIIPAGAGKGTAVESLRVMRGFNVEQVVVAGDSVNDREMFLHSYRGIVVGNADTHLKALTGPLIYHAQKYHAAGVLEGLRHWGVLNP
ncbi:MAG: HAD family hydrolase [Anaerolineales bacterium]|nr:HAD family hydrolase [Anaerolineales bacterium]